MWYIHLKALLWLLITMTTHAMNMISLSILPFYFFPTLGALLHFR